jgi:hypothetical protein
MSLLVDLIKMDEALAIRAVQAGAVPELIQVLHWGAQRLEWLARQGLWEEEVETPCTNACSGLTWALSCSGPSAVMSAVPGWLTKLVQLAQLLRLVLQHSRSYDALGTASRLLAMLDPRNTSMQALDQGAAELLRQLQPGGQPDRAAAIAALLCKLTGKVQQQQQAGGSGAAAAPPVRPSSSEAAAQAGGQTAAVAAECAACKALPPAGHKFQVCAGCRAVRYCSPACQKAGWQSGHKAACRAKSGGAKV